MLPISILISNYQYSSHYCRIKLWIYSHLSLKNSSIWKLSIYPITQSLISHTVNSINKIVATLPNLETLIVEHNNVKDFKVFSGTIEEGWKNLRILNLSFNKISDLSSLAAVPNLRELYLTQNRIEKVENFGGHPKLKILELRRNKISTLTGIGAM